MGVVEIESKTLAVGTRVVITLAGLGAAGYRWSATVEHPGIVTVEKVVVACGPEARQPGASHEEAFSLCAAAVGETTVRFAQARSFETGVAPNAVREIRVRVTPEVGL
jgi:predicted secreted protein